MSLSPDSVSDPLAEPVVTPDEQAAIQRRTVGVLALGQVLGGIAFGATISLGALLAADLSGSDALSGTATAAVTLGAALAAIPLARFASRAGRRWSLTLGNLLALVGIVTVVTAAAVRVFPLLLVGILLIGMGNAGNLQSRFAAADLAEPSRRGRDLSIVVWATTVGAVAGPLLLGPGEKVGHAVGMPPLTGSFLFSVVAQTLALILYLVALRPDPLLTAQRIAHSAKAAERLGDVGDNAFVARFAIFAIAGSHVVMVAVMAMTPIHLAHMAHDAHGGHASTEQISVLVGITIAAHVAGMYALSPIFGALADRWGRLKVVLLGQAMLATSLVCTMVASHTEVGVLIALILLGLGWSASTVAGAALLTEASAPDLRTVRQGKSDALMSLAGATGALVAGPVLTAWQFTGLGAVTMIVVAAIVVASPFAARRMRHPVAAERGGERLPAA